MTPITMVDTVGVRYLGCIFENEAGRALKAAIDRVVRAVGRIVVWVDAAAELSTIRISRRVRNVPNPPPPKIAPPRTESTSLVLAGLFRPIPFAPIPANATTATITIAYVMRSSRVERIAARPGVLFLSLVSSLIETAVSQPQ